MEKKHIIMDDAAVGRAVARISYEIIERNKGVENICVVGIISRGAPIGKRIAAKLEDRVGALCDVIHILALADINIEYVYAFTASEDFGAYVVIRVDDAAKAEQVLKDNNIPTLNEEDIKDI